jgi:PGF-CTERM protein
MPPHRLVVVLVLVAACLLGAPLVTADNGVTMTVTVVNQTGEPVGSGVTVAETWDGGETTAQTAANGRVFVDVPEGVDVELDVVDDDGYVRNRPLVVADADERDVELQVSPQGVATVSVNDTGGDPVPDATVRFRRGGEVISSGETDADGVFESAIVEQGDYSVQVVKPGYYRVSRRVTVGAETESGFMLEAGRVPLDVVVFDDHFAEPQRLSDARVLVDGTGFDANVSAGDGSASLSVPVNTRYRIVAVKSGYDGERRTLDVREEARSVNVTAQRIPELVVTVSNQRVVVGETTRVEVTNAYGEPVPNATVQLDGSEAGTTDDRGEVSVRIEAAGNRTIVASGGGLDSDPVTVTGVDSDAGTDTGTPTNTETSTEAESTPTETSGQTPGFGVVVSVAALLIAFGVRVRSP